jgi:hypothetical protein
MFTTELHERSISDVSMPDLVDRSVWHAGRRHVRPLPRICQQADR